jgi:hypothetical protein
MQPELSMYLHPGTRQSDYSLHSKIRGSGVSYKCLPGSLLGSVSGDVGGSSTSLHRQSIPIWPFCLELSPLFLDFPSHCLYRVKICCLEQIWLRLGLPATPLLVV